MLILQFTQVVVSSQSSNTQHVLEIWVIHEDILQVFIMQTIDSGFLSLTNARIRILISNLKNVACVTNVAALIEMDEHVLPFLVGNLDFTFVYEVDLGADDVESQN